MGRWCSLLTITAALSAGALGCKGKDEAPVPSPDRGANETGAEAKTNPAEREPKAAPTADAKNAAPSKPLEERAAATPSALAPAAEPKLAGKTTPTSNAPSPTTPETAAPTAPLPTERAPLASAAPPPTEPEPPPPPPVVSPKVAESNFSLWMQSSGRYKAGQQGFVEVVLVPKGDFHCNQEYPYKVKMGAAPAGVTYPTAIVRTEGLSVSPSRATMRVPFVAQNAGDAKVSGQFFFSVCTSEQCVIDNRAVAVTVKVE